MLSLLFSQAAKLFGGLSLKLWLYTIVLAGVLSVVAGAYIKGRIDCSHSGEIAQLKEQNKALKYAMTTLEADGKAATSANVSLQQFKSKADGIENKVTDGKCFSDVESNSLRGLWK